MALYKCLKNGGGANIKDYIINKFNAVGNPQTPTIILDRANIVSGGFVEEYIRNDALMDVTRENYIVYWYITFTYNLAIKAGEVYGAVFTDFPEPKTWGRGFSMGTTLYSDNDDMLVLYKGDGVLYAQMTCRNAHPINTQFTFYGMYPTQKITS